MVISAATTLAINIGRVVAKCWILFSKLLQVDTSESTIMHARTHLKVDGLPSPQDKIFLGFVLICVAALFILICQQVNANNAHLCSITISILITCTSYVHVNIVHGNVPLFIIQ